MECRKRGGKAQPSRFTSVLRHPPSVPLDRTYPSYHWHVRVWQSGVDVCCATRQNTVTCLVSPVSRFPTTATSSRPTYESLCFCIAFVTEKVPTMQKVEFKANQMCPFRNSVFSRAMPLREPCGSCQSTSSSPVRFSEPTERLRSSQKRLVWRFVRTTGSKS